MNSFLARLRRAFQSPTMTPFIRHRRGADGCHHISIALRVWLYEEADMWVAQGIDVDYAAAGNTLEDVKDRFARGLIASVEANLDEFGTLEHLCKRAPDEIWRAFLESAAEAESQQRLLTERTQLAGLQRFNAKIPSFLEYTQAAPAHAH